MKEPNWQAIELATDEEKHTLMGLAIGRMFRMASRPPQPGDADAMHDIIRIVKVCAPSAMAASVEREIDNAPNYVRDRLKGAQGDS